MIKVIAILSLLLTLSSGGLYIQHLKLKAKDVEIATQLDTIKSLDKEVKDKTDRLEIERGMNATINLDTKVSNNSFGKLADELKSLNCNPAKEVKQNATNKETDVDPIVIKYYNILQSAYSLQNKN